MLRSAPHTKKTKPVSRLPLQLLVEKVERNEDNTSRAALRLSLSETKRHKAQNAKRHKTPKGPKCQKAQNAIGHALTCAPAALPTRQSTLSLIRFYGGGTGRGDGCQNRQGSPKSLQSIPVVVENGREPLLARL